jgi:RNA polymerase sigma-70 factor (ECF subfamily)
MPPATTPPQTAPPPDPIAAAVGEQTVLDDLNAHAAARLGLWLADKPAAFRADAVEEVVQTTLERALKSRAKFDPCLATPAGWLHGILDRVLSEHCRRVRKQPIQPVADPVRWDRLEAKLTAPDCRAELEPLLARLSSEQREIITLSHLDGLTHAELAGRLGISPGAARVRLCRAMGELTRIAAASGEGDR